VGETQVEVRQNIGGSTCIVFVIAEVCEVGATPTRSESEYWGSTCIVFVIAKVCEVGVTWCVVQRASCPEHAETFWLSLVPFLRTICNNNVSFAIGFPAGISHRLYPAGSSRIQDIINWNRKCSTTADSSRTHLYVSPESTSSVFVVLLVCSVKGSKICHCGSYMTSQCG
jgi:hypothetical protein